MARLERRDDAFGAAQAMERGERLVVGDADVLGAADVLEVGVLGADAGIVEAGRDRVRLDDLAVRRPAAGRCGCRAARRGCRRCSEAACLPLSRPSPAASTPISARLLVRRCRDRRCPSRCCRRRRRRPPRRAGAPIISGICTQAFVADHALEVAHHRRVRMRAGDGADDVEGVLDVGHPVAQRLVERVLQRLASRDSTGTTVAPSRFMR